MLSFRLVVVSVAIMAAIACGGSSSSSTSPSQTPPPPAPAPGATSSVAIPVGAAALGASAYAPDDLNVTVSCAQDELCGSLVGGNLDSPRPSGKQAQRDPVRG